MYITIIEAMEVVDSIPGRGECRMRGADVLVVLPRDDRHRLHVPRFEAFLITISRAYCCTLNLDLRSTLVLGVSFTLGCIEESRTP